MVDSTIVVFIVLNLVDRLTTAAPNQGLILTEMIDTDDSSTWNKDVLYCIIRACIVKQVNDAILVSSHSSYACDFIKVFLGFETTSAFIKFSNAARRQGVSGTELAFSVDFYGSYSNMI